MNSPDILPLLIAAAIMGGLTAYLAKGRGRDPVKWFFVGMLCGVFGLMALFFFPVLPAEGEKPAGSPVAPPIAAPVDVPVVAVKWYYLDSQHNTLGPVAEDALPELVKEQKITNRTYLWKQGMDGWKRLEDLSDLYRKIQPTT